MSSVTLTMITPTAFGSMCLKMIRVSLAPATRAASTNSRSRSERNSPRTRRASGGHSTSPRNAPRMSALLPPESRASTAPMTMTGIVMMRSVNRISHESVRPR
ncbi:Uncharacterised protein [Mycobacteroides abscessus]|nr:Uncharacterised protein [Mycobacteroides abscessus]